MRARLVLFLALAASLMPAMGCGRGHEQRAAKLTILPVAATTVQHLKSFDYPITYYGRIAPARRAALSFERPGRLAEVLVDEGANVAAGQVLARLDRSLLEAEKGVLLSQRKTASAMLDRLQRGERAEVIAAARAEAMRLEVELNRAEAENNRAEKGFATNTISRAELEQAQYTYAAAVHAREQAKHRLEELESGSRVEDIEAQESRVGVIDAQLRLLDVQFEKSVLVAPFDCVTIRRLQDEGVSLASGQIVLEVNEANRLEARFSIPYANLALISGVKDVQINGNRYPISGVRAISEIDDVMRTVDILIPLQVNPQDRILPGQTCTMVLSKPIQAECIELPISALVASIRGLWSCYQLQPNSPDQQDRSGQQTYTIEKIGVTIIHSDGSRALVSAALTEGSLIVSAGVDKVVPGTQVQIVAGAL